MTAHRARRLCFTTVLCLAAPAIRAQPSPVIQTETREVLVDAVVTGKGGAYIRNLTAKDFRIAQDGKEQAIKSFTFQASPADAQQRSMVLFFDQTSIQPRDMVEVRRAASSFIDADAGPNRMMAVVAFSGTVHVVQSFTDNAGRLKDGVIQASSQGLIQAAESGGLRDRSLGADRTLDPGGNIERANSASSATVNSLETRDMIRSLGELGRSLGVLPGRKIVILFSGALQFNNDQRSEIRETVEAANKSGVAFYPVDVRPVLNQTDAGRDFGPLQTRSRLGGDGLKGEPTDAGDLSTTVADAGAASQQVFFGLANGTGGIVVRNTADLLGALQRVAEEQNAYYTLTYTPPAAKEGSCHTIKVKVNSKGASVRARSSYCAAMPVDLLAGTAAARDLEKYAVSEPSGEIGASLQLPYFYTAPNVARVMVTMEIRPETLTLDAAKGKRLDLNFLGIAAGADGDVKARFSDTLKLDLNSPSQAARVKGKSLHYEREFRIVPGQYTFTLALSQTGGGFGKIQIPLTIPPWDGSLGISGLVWSRETHPASELGLNLELEDRTPLIANGVEFVPSGSAQFTAGQMAFFYFEVNGSDAPNAKLRVRVLDRKSGDPKWDGGFINLPKAVHGAKMVAAGGRLPLDSLPAGSYQLELTAVAAGKEVKSVAVFGVGDR